MRREGGPAAARGPFRREPGPAAVLVACSGGAAVGVALANVASLALARDTARVRDLRPLAALRVALDGLDVPLFAALPRIVHAPFALDAGAALAGFTALAIVVYLLGAVLAAAAAAAVVVPVARRRARPPDRWPPSLPVAVFAAGIAPIAAHRLGLWTAWPWPVVAAASVATAAAAGWLGARVLGTPARARRLVALAAWLALAGGGAAALGIPLAVAVTRPAPAPPPPSRAPDVLLISIDTLRPDHLGSYGYARDTSPTIDALAAAGARFTTVVSPTSWTLPAHASLLTALPPEIHGVTEDRFRIGRETRTLAEVLRAHGWATAGFVSGPYLDAAYGFARGFDRYDDWSALRVSAPAVHRARTSPALHGAVADWLAEHRRRDAGRPWFVFVHMWDVHYDFNPPPPFDTMFDPDYRGTATALDFDANPAIHAGMDPRDLAHVVALYDGEIRYTDGWVRRILDEVARGGSLDDAIVVVTSDHGEEFFEHGQKGHHKALWDESIRVPLVIRHPATVPAGTVVDAQVRLVDVAPTILALAGVPASPAFGAAAADALHRGRDLSPLLDPARASGVRPLAAVAGLEPFGFTAIRTAGHKLLRGFFTAPSERLFDLRADPGERHDLAARDPGTAAALRGALADWRRTAADLAQLAEAAATSAEHEAALRALGYVE